MKKVITPKKYMEEKICKIVNDRFSWVLEVDKKEIPFQGRSNALYFETIFKQLGYTIVWDLDKYKQT